MGFADTAWLPYQTADWWHVRVEQPHARNDHLRHKPADGILDGPRLQLVQRDMTHGMYANVRDRGHGKGATAGIFKDEALPASAA